MNLSYKIDKKRPYKSIPELYYIEGHPIPIGTDDVEEFIDIVGKDGKTTKIKKPSKSSSFLDRLVIKNALKEVGKPKSLMWEVVAGKFGVADMSLSKLKAFRKIKDFIDVVVIGSGLNFYKRIDWNVKEVEINGTSYKIAQNKLFIAPRTEGKPEAVDLPPATRKDPPSDILFIAERSDALKKGLEDLFRTTILSRKVVLFIIIAVGILAFAYLYSTGQLPELSIPL
ncbi:MAG: hypothetical protein ACYTAN_17095 [Planctomycetota bacterium]